MEALIPIKNAVLISNYKCKDDKIGECILAAHALTAKRGFFFIFS
jgi:hypothetical protein